MENWARGSILFSSVTSRAFLASSRTMCRPCSSILVLATATYAFQLGITTSSTRTAPRRLRQLAVCQQLDFDAMRLGELRSLLKARGVSIEGCFDRDSLVERADKFRCQLESVPVPAPPAWPGGEPVEQGPVRLP